MQGEMAVLMYPSCIEYMAAFFGCLYADVVAIPAFPLRKNKNGIRVKAILEDSNAKLVLTSHKADKRLEHMFSVFNIFQAERICTEDIPTEDTLDTPTITGSLDSIAYLQYTSGSTGSPKGAVITHRNLLNNLQGNTECFKIDPDQSAMLSWMPIHHDLGLVYGMLQPVYDGFPSYFMPPVQFVQKPLRWLRSISRYGITLSGGPNFAYDLCVEKIRDSDMEMLDLSKWQVTITGAEPIRINTINSFNERFQEVGWHKETFVAAYGLAEATLRVTSSTLEHELPVLYLDAEAVERHEVKISDASPNKAVIGCGLANVGNEVVVVDPHSLNECTRERIGEIWIKGPTVAEGYFNKPALNTDTFEAHTSSGKGPYLRTGDLGFIHGDDLYVTGRIKEMIIVRGANHYPQDLEYTVRQCSDHFKPNTTAVFSISADSGERIVIVQEIDAQALQHEVEEQRADALFENIREEIYDKHELSVADIVLTTKGAVLKTSSGKVQRVAMASAYQNHELKILLRSELVQNRMEDELPSESDTQLSEKPDFEEVCEWLSLHLSKATRVDVDQMDFDEPFSSYGLDSSMATSLSGVISEALAMDMDPIVFWEYTTIDALSEHLMALIERPLNINTG